MIRAIADWAMIVVFVSALWLALVGTFLRHCRGPTEEWRPLASFPEWSLKGSALKSFPTRFEQYWSDHFGFRGTLIHWTNLAKVCCLHVSTSANVLLGRASWLFYTRVPPGSNYDDIRPFTLSELERWEQVLRQRHDWLARRGCRYLLFIPPDKQTIYPEYLDPVYRSRHARSRLDQLIDHLRIRRCPVEVIDIRPAMLAAKPRERLYHCFDTHWNDRGAYIGYQHLADALAKLFPAIQPTPRSALVETADERSAGDLANLVGIADRRREEWLNLVPRFPLRARESTDAVVWPAKASFPLGKPFAMERDDPRLPRAVMFHDSFFIALRPLLSEHFRRIVYVWHDDFHQDVIEREKPEVVIQELLERKLGFVVPNALEERSAP